MRQVKKIARKQNIDANNIITTTTNNNDERNDVDGDIEVLKSQKRKTKFDDSDSSDCAFNPSSNDSGLTGNNFIAG